MFKAEWKRAILGRNMKIAILIGWILVLYHFWESGGFGLDPIEWYRKELNTTLLVETNVIHNTWIGGVIGKMQNYLYWILIPFLATLPYASSYYEDRYYGLIPSFFSREKRKKYYMTKWIVNFLVGGIAVVLPLLFSITLSLTYSTWMKPALETLMYEIEYPFENIVLDLFLNHTIWYYCLYLLLIFIVSGLLANIGFSATLVYEKPYIPQIVPFIVYLILDVWAYFIRDPHYGIRFYFNPTGAKLNLTMTLFYLGILFILAAAPFYYAWRKKVDF